MIINESLSVPWGSMKGLLLFYKLSVAGARDSENTFKLDITEVNVVVSRIPNKVYSQGKKTKDMWEEVFRRFGKETAQ